MQRKTVLQQRTLCFGSNYDRSTILLTFRTSQYFLDILDPFHFCAGDAQFFPDNFFPLTSIRVLQYGQFQSSSETVHKTSNTDNLARISSLGGFEFPFLAFITTDSLFQRLFRSKRIRRGFHLIEQIQQSRKVVRFCPFTRNPKQLFFRYLTVSLRSAIV